MLYVSHNHHRNDFVDPTGISKLVKIHLLDTRIMAAVACLFSRDEVVFLRHAEFALRGEFTLHHADEVFVMGNGYKLKVCLCGSSGECLFVSLSYCFLLCVSLLYSGPEQQHKIRIAIKRLLRSKIISQAV